MMERGARAVLDNVSRDPDYYFKLYGIRKDNLKMSKSNALIAEMRRKVTKRRKVSCADWVLTRHC
jgi:hypothetical protein